MNDYQQQVWALSNALAGLLRDSEASKFPPSLRQKTRELQQSCNRLQHYIATSTSRIQKDVGECIEDLKSIEPSEQQPRRLRRKLSNVEEYLLSVSETLQSQESRAQDLELEIRCLEDDFFGGADGCRQLGEFLDRQQQSVSEHRGFVKQLETEIDVMKDDLSNLQKRLSTASDAMDDDDIADASRICDRLAERLGELVKPCECHSDVEGEAEISEEEPSCPQEEDLVDQELAREELASVSKLLQEATHEQFYIGE
ncbi:Uncharacterized protein SCF082_LOCUS41095, partial [Durusdinium trenchii]